MFFLNLLSSGISILNVSLSPILTVSTSRLLESKILIRGGGASGAEVILIISGSLKQEKNKKMNQFSSGNKQLKCNNLIKTNDRRT